MAATLVQKNTNYASTIAYSGAVTTGNILVVCCSGQAGSDAIAVSDSQSNSWTKVVSHQVASGVGGFVTNVNAGIFMAVSKNSLTPTITISGVSDPGGGVYEYSGLTATTDGTTAEHVASTASPTASNLITTVTDVIVAMVAQEQTSGTFSASTGGFTLENNNGSHVDGSSDKQNAVAGTYASIHNFGSSAPWVVLQVALKVATGSSSGASFLLKMI